MPGLTLWSMPSSGNSYKVRLLLAHLGTPCTLVSCEAGSPALDAARAQGAAPLGQLPALHLPDGRILTESGAILWYLAQGTPWIPADPLAQAEMLRWMFFEQNRLEPTIAVRAALRSYPERAAEATPARMAALLESGTALLALLDRQLAGRDWAAGTAAPSLADLALYGYTHSAGTRGGYDLAPLPALRAWLDRVAALPGHVPLQAAP